MDNFWIVIVILILLAILLWLWSRMRREGSGNYQYRLADFNPNNISPLDLDGFEVRVGKGSVPNRLGQTLLINVVASYDTTVIEYFNSAKFYFEMREPIVTGLINHSDKLLYDEYSHASFCDGIKMANIDSHRFKHNSTDALAKLLNHYSPTNSSDVFIGVEGVYSMDGDLAPLDKIVPLAKRNGSILMIDDAHGAGVLGKTGSGTAEHFGVINDVDIIMGTFSKTFGVVGGFVCSSKPIIDYLRFFARSYMFSASLPPVVISAVLAGLDIIESEPGLRENLKENIKYTLTGIRKLGINADTQSAIIALRVPETMNIRKAAYKFHEMGIFVNSVEYPAVPLNQQRFRISLMANHTKKDIDRLLECIQEVWNEFNDNKIHTKAA